jgi:hypothetical protein
LGALRVPRTASTGARGVLAKRQTQRELGTQSHGTHPGSAGLPNRRSTSMRTVRAIAVLAGAVGAHVIPQVEAVVAHVIPQVGAHVIPHRERERGVGGVVLAVRKLLSSEQADGSPGGEEKFQRGRRDRGFDPLACGPIAERGRDQSGGGPQDGEEVPDGGDRGRCRAGRSAAQQRAVGRTGPGVVAGAGGHAAAPDHVAADRGPSPVRGGHARRRGHAADDLAAAA